MQIEPNECAITAPLALNLKFTLARPVENAYWAVQVSGCLTCGLPLPFSPRGRGRIEGMASIFAQYVVDSVRRRHVIGEEATGNSRTAMTARAAFARYPCNREVIWAHVVKVVVLLVCSAELGKTAPASLAAGDHTMDFSAASVNVSGLKPSRLATAGILACSLRSKGGGPGAPEEGDVEHAAVNMVVQVETDDGAPAKRTTPADSLIRTVFDPLA